MREHDESLECTDRMDHEGTGAPYNNNELAPSWLPGRPRPIRPAIDHTAARAYGSVDSEVLSHQPETLGARLGIAIQTAREWRRLKRVPNIWIRAVRALIIGDLGVIDRAWNGWRIDGRLLRSPDGGDYVFTVADIMSLPLTRLRLGQAERLLEQLEQPQAPADTLTLQWNWLSRDCEQHAYPTDRDTPEEISERQDADRLWQRAKEHERQRRFLKWTPRVR